MKVIRGFLGALLGVTLAAGGAAHADVRVFDDAGDVSSSVDILRVRVDNGSTRPGQIRVRITHDDLVIGDEITAFLDVRRRDPGPEWKVTGLPAAEWALIRVERWADTGTEVTCGPGRMRIDQDTDVTRVVVPWSCLGTSPRKVRVAVRVTRDDPVARDWAAGPRTFLGWVAPAEPAR